MRVESTVREYLRLLDVPAGEARRSAWVGQYEAAPAGIFATYYRSWGNPGRRRDAADAVAAPAAAVTGRELVVPLLVSQAAGSS